ncbi:MAG TPA: FHA domain-containing protein [Planctomycetota bacterium]
MASITISCDGTEQKVALETASVTLGRGLESDIRLKDIKASRRHCQIAKAGSGFQLIDLSSGNGTFINGVQVKQQALNPGDKIQIGSTTITFHDGAAAPAKAPPAKTTTAAVAAAPAARTSQSKVATAQLPVAQTRKMTARVEAVKPSTQGVKKAGTQAIAKSATGVMKKTTQRPGGTSRAIGKATATQKFHSEARKAKSNPVVMILVGIGIIFVGIVGFIMFGTSGGNENQMVADRFKKLSEEAAKAESDRNYDEAIKKTKELLALIGNLDQYKGDAANLKGQVKILEESKKLMAEATGRFEAFRKKFDDMKPEQARDLWKEGKDLEAAVKDAGFDWYKELRLIIERIDKTIDTDAAIAKRQDFQVIRNENEAKYKLGSPEPDYSGAIKEWQQYLTQPSADKAKTEQVLQSINLKAKGEFLRLKGRAERNADKAAAIADAQKHLPRFELTDVGADFKKLLEDLKPK